MANPTTRERLLAEGLRLFAEQGFRETSVGEIESAAGLKPRRGTLYNHFPSKQALLEEAVRSRLGVMSQATEYLTHLPLGDVRADALLIGRLLLAGLEEGDQLTRIIERDGHRLPALRDLVREQFSDAGFRAASELARNWLAERRDEVDTDALAVAMVGGLLHFQRSRSTFGAPPLGIDDERFLDMWSRLCVIVTEAGLKELAAPPPRSQRKRKAGARRSRR